jgi:hypothetical protein
MTRETSRLHPAIIPQPIGWKRIGNQIDPTMIFAQQRETIPRAREGASIKRLASLHVGSTD